MPNIINSFCMSQSLPLRIAVPRFFTIKKYYCTQFCIQKKPKSLCNWKTVALHSANSGEVPHTESTRWLHDPSHAVPTFTITVLSASCAVHSFTNTHTLTQILIRQLNSNISLTLYLRHTSLYTINVIPRATMSVKISKLREACVVTESQIRMSTMLFLLTREPTLMKSKWP